MTDALRQVPLIDGPARVRGASEVVATEAGVLPRRLPSWTIAQSDASMERQATAGSGVRLAFRSAATVVELDVLTTVPMPAQNEPRPDDAGVFEVTCDGVAVGDAVRAPVGNVLLMDAVNTQVGFVPGRPATVRFDALPAGPKDVEIWLPHWVKTELVALRADAEVEPPTPTGRRVWLHHGSSISQGSNAAGPATTWPALAAAAGGVDLLNLGFGGGALLEDRKSVV